MTTDERRPMIPDLDAPCPDCSVCGKETWHDGDSLRCDDCGIYWSDGLGGGEYLTDAPMCASVIEWWNRPDLKPENEQIRHILDRCLLPWPHEGKHRSDPLHTWEATDPRVIAVGETA